MQSQSHRLINEQTWAVLIPFLCEPAKAVPKINSLILVLFLGTTVALAKIHVENDPPHKAPHPVLVSLNSLLYVYVSSPTCVSNLKESTPFEIQGCSYFCLLEEPILMLLFCIACLYSAYSLSSFWHPFTRLLFMCINFFLFYFSDINIIDMSCQLLFVCVSDQHESLCYFGHWAHFNLAIYYYISFLFLITVISVNTVKVIIFVNSAKK